MTVFEVKSKKYLIIKILITQICITVFILQSYQEVIKFFRSLTSVSIRTEAVVDLQYPTIVICLKEPFKAAFYPKTLEEFNNQTYRMDEIININTLYPSEKDGLQVKEVATFWSGKCFVLDTPSNWTYSKWLGMQLKSGHDLRIHFVEAGQEVCMIYGYCNEQYETIVLEQDFNEAYIKAKKIIRPPGSCVDDIYYNQYDCIMQNVEKRLKREIHCRFPYQAFNEVLTEKNICANFSDYELSYIAMVEVLDQEIISNSHCKPNCVSWNYDVKVRHMTQKTFTATVPRVRNNDSTFDHWSRFWLKLEGPDIKLHEEYIVYDFNGIVGTVGGSLGLFIGFSFLDFLIYLLNKAKEACERDADVHSSERHKTEDVEPNTDFTDSVLFTYGVHNFPLRGRKLSQS